MATPKAKFRIEGEDATAAAFRSVIGNANKASAGIKSAMKFAFVGFSVNAIVGVAARAIEAGDELNKFAIKAGIGGRAASELAHAAKMADIEIGGLATGIKKMQVNLSEAAHGGKAQQQALADLGLTFEELKKLAPDRQFELIADRISKLKDPADRTRAAVDQFGKAGADLLPMFEQGAAGIRMAREEAVRLGKSLSEEQIKKLADADTAVKQLTASWEGFSGALVSKVAPAISAVLQLLHGDLTGGFGTEELQRQNTLQKRLEQTKAALAANDSNWLDNMNGANDRRRKIIADTEADLIRINKLLHEMDEVVPTGQKVASTNPLAGLSDVRSSGIRLGVEPGAYDAIIADYEKRMGDATSDALRVALAEGSKGFDTLYDSMGKWKIPATDFAKAIDEAVNKTVDLMEAMPDRAREFAMSAQSDFEQFFFDPVHKGIKGLARDLLDSLRAAIAQSVTDKLFGSKASGGMGIGGAIVDFGKSLFGFADGGSFKVGGSGGTDSQMVAFRASPDETVTITKPGQRGGAIVYSPVTHISGTGLNERQLAAVIDRNNKQQFARITGLIRGGAFA